MQKRQFTAKLKGILEHNAIERPLEREKAGLINQKRIGKALTSERVFRKRGDIPQERKYSVEILIDSSGSMDGSKREVAAKAVRELGDVLRQIKGVEFEIAEFGFTDFVLKPFKRDFHPSLIDTYERQEIHTYSVYKKGSDFFDTPEKYGDDMLTKQGYERLFTAGYGGNTDGLAVWRAYQRLLKRDGKKILIVMSDGQPVQDYEWGQLIQDTPRPTIRGDKYAAEIIRDIDNPDRALRKVTSRISKERQVIMLGLGIQSSAVKQYYPITRQVNDLANLFSSLTALLAKEIKKV